MRRRECPREADVLEALQASAWPDCCASDLRVHVGACESCAELVDVVLPLLADHRAATIAAPVPSSAVMWWRLQTRARQEATRQAMRPIAAIQGLALACAAGLLLAAISLTSPAVRQFAVWFAGAGAQVIATGIPAGAWAGIELASPLGISLALSATLLCVVTPVAIYFAISDR